MDASPPFFNLYNEVVFEEAVLEEEAGTTIHGKMWTNKISSKDIFKG